MKYQYKARVRFLAKGGADANESAQSQFYDVLTQNYKTEFAENQALSNSLQQLINPIIQAGEGQYGFDTTEDNALRSDATNQDVTAFTNQKQALQNEEAAQNGGVSVMPSGAQEQLNEELGVQQAQKIANDQTAITEAGYTQGRQDYQNAMNEEFGLLSNTNPNAYASSAVGGGNAVNGAVQAEAAMDNSWMSVVGGALGGAGSAFGGYMAGR